jgi:acyl-CoA synthetase (AMP-forming)/AMP-acid ligase II
VAGLAVRRVVDRPIPPVRGEQIAYLQYTSGSTRAPAGVMISHANVLANARQTLAGYGVRPGDGTTTVSWLPLFHDMGLVLGVAAPLVAGCRSVLMDPVAFLERPARWLKLLSGNPNAVSAAPNFAYGYAAARVSERERDWLHLDAVKALINGAEPVWPATIEKFQRAFGECGLRPETHRPSYGLAEATVLVTVSPMGTAPRTTTFDRDALAAGRAIPPATPDAPVSTLVSCGVPVGQTVRVVDPRRGTPAPDGQVGEIWVTGPNVARGYWDNEPATARSFQARLIGKGTVGARENWLRTGDLGVLCDGELYVTGRRKDLVIVGGRNHYPQDIELTVEQAHTAVRAHHVVAFAVPAAEQDGLVVLAERARDLGPDGVNRDELAATVRAAISARHTVALHDFALLEPGQVPRTSSGKVARAAARSAYLSGAFDAVGARGGAAR